MILYTPVPAEYVFPQKNDEQKPLQEIQVNGVIMQVEPLSAKQAKIVRLISPNPSDFLNPRYAPGQIIDFAPVFHNR
ncbi:MAG TPA: YlzJ-like family protein [Bacilli bacterium]